MPESLSSDVSWAFVAGRSRKGLGNPGRGCGCYFFLTLWKGVLARIVHVFSAVSRDERPKDVSAIGTIQTCDFVGNSPVHQALDSQSLCASSPRFDLDRRYSRPSPPPWPPSFESPAVPLPCARTSLAGPPVGSAVAPGAFGWFLDRHFTHEIRRFPTESSGIGDRCA